MLIGKWDLILNVERANRSRTSDNLVFEHKSEVYRDVAVLKDIHGSEINL